MHRTGSSGYPIRPDLPPSYFATRQAPEYVLLPPTNINLLAELTQCEPFKRKASLLQLRNSPNCGDDHMESLMYCILAKHAESPALWLRVAAQRILLQSPSSAISNQALVIQKAEGDRDKWVQCLAKLSKGYSHEVIAGGSSNSLLSLAQHTHEEIPLVLILRSLRRAVKEDSDYDSEGVLNLTDTLLRKTVSVSVFTLSVDIAHRVILRLEVVSADTKQVALRRLAAICNTALSTWRHHEEKAFLQNAIQLIDGAGANGE